METITKVVRWIIECDETETITRHGKYIVAGTSAEDAREQMYRYNPNAKNVRIRLECPPT